MATAVIPLTRGLVSIIDEDDFELAGRYRWHAAGVRDYFYACRAVRVSGQKFTVGLHHMFLPPIPGFVIDHRDGDRLNNCRSNLRYATFSQNSQNRMARRDTGNPFKGIKLTKGKWAADICVRGRSIRLGTFATPEEAHQAYVCAAVKHYEPFARFA